MYVLAILALAGALLASFQGLASQYAQLANLYRTEAREARLQAVASRISNHLEVTGSLPASLEAMAQTPGYEDVRGLTEVAEGYVLSPQINDGSWSFQRAVFFSRNPGQSAADYLSTNLCGTGSADAAGTVSWCGSKESRWFRRETREDFAAQINSQRARLNRSLQKFAAAFNAGGSFADQDQAGDPLVAGNVYSLPALAGYAGTAAACRGPYALRDGTALDCGDLFDQWGQAVAYQFNSTKYVLLISESPIANSAGNSVVIASELDASSL